MEIGHQPILSRITKFTRERREKKDLSRASSAAKVLVVELIRFALPDAPGALRWRRVDGCTGPQRQVTYSPFRNLILQPATREFNGNTDS